ncbi:Calponin homology domain-containing protein [Cynara cardunculus var. scolymus]|uniref:Calponin homology domain-containing protein n=1 Tax=Cynara cardunculus var. scolymus TaxID=59895 RepID=A0A124SB60_CYNCS|nr:Calponin homology domain-containing protein [Cynara cardunculus var. scolymus]
MEPKQQPQQHKQQIPSSPLPNSSSSSSLLLRDISNYKTPKPKRPFLINPSFDVESPCSQFFTALKRTPKSSNSTVGRRPRCSFAAKKLKAIEIEQSISSRKTQTNKEKSLKSLAKSLTVWLNFLFENPRSCGVEVSRFTGEDSSDGPSVVFLGAKRDSVSHGGVEVDREWRGPKRRKDTLWVHKGEMENQFSSSIYSRLQASLGDVCSLDDMKERMTLYLSLTSCKEIFDNIDEGRLKMKAHCPIVTDVGMKEKALKILMGYNPVWLRIGLYIIFGGESLLPNPNTDMDSEQEVSFLKMVAEKLFFSHSGLAKAYIYNKLVDGLYRPGYYEKLGSVILKKFLLLALILDRAKSQSSLPISYGVDGIDGGSPSLFTPRATIKSSSEVISDFLSSDVMHGVGNLLAHLMIIGYKVSYQQNPLVKYVFKVADLFNDLQDGILLCRVIQLLQHDPSILKKVVVPSDDRKKNLVNCEISVQYLKQIGVPLCDEDGTEIIAEDIVNGDKELIISLLWNMFVHLQLPLLVNNKLDLKETNEVSIMSTSDYVDAVHNFLLSQKLTTLLGNFPEVLQVSDILEYKGACNERDRKCIRRDRVLGNHEEQFTVDETCQHGSRDKERNFKAIMSWWQEMAQHNSKANVKPAVSFLQAFMRVWLMVKNTSAIGKLNMIKIQEPLYDGTKLSKRFSKYLVDRHAFIKLRRSVVIIQRAMRYWTAQKCQTNAAIIIQKCVRGCVARSIYVRTNEIQMKAALRIQVAWRNHVNESIHNHRQSAATLIQTCYRCWLLRKSFLNQKQAAIKIQTCYRGYILRKSFLNKKQAITVVQSYYRGFLLRKSFLDQKQAAIRIQTHYRGKILRKSFVNQKQAATKIQSHYRGWFSRNSFLNQKQAAARIQSLYRGWFSRNSFLRMKQAVTKLQRLYRIRKSLRNFEHYKLEIKSAVTIQSHARGWIARRVAFRHRCFIVLIQSFFRVWLTRREFVLQKEAAIKIQSAFRRFKCFKAFNCYTDATIVIQQSVRGCIARKRLLGCNHDAPKDCFDNHELKTYAIIIQSGVRGWIARRKTAQKRRTKSAIVIQSWVRGWIARKTMAQRRHRIVLIQSYWKGYIERKHSRGKLSDIRLRVQKSAANVLRHAISIFRNLTRYPHLTDVLIDTRGSVSRSLVFLQEI